MLISAVHQGDSSTSERAMPSLDCEFDYYISHQREIVDKYAGQYVVIHDQKVQGAYPDELTALGEARKKFSMGDFIVQRVEAGTDSFTQTFYSRAAFF